MDDRQWVSMPMTEEQKTAAAVLEEWAARRWHARAAAMAVRLLEELEEVAELPGVRHRVRAPLEQRFGVSLEELRAELGNDDECDA